MGSLLPFFEPACGTFPVVASIRLAKGAATHDGTLHALQRFQAEFHLVLIENCRAQCVPEASENVRVTRTKTARLDQRASDTRIGYLLLEQPIEELMKGLALQ